MLPTKNGMQANKVTILHIYTNCVSVTTANIVVHCSLNFFLPIKNQKKKRKCRWKIIYESVETSLHGIRLRSVCKRFPAIYINVYWNVYVLSCFALASPLFSLRTTNIVGYARFKSLALPHQEGKFFGSIECYVFFSSKPKYTHFY